MNEKIKYVFAIIIGLVLLEVLFLAYINQAQDTEIINLSNRPSPFLTLSPSSTVKMIFVGDIMLSRSVGLKMEKLGDYSYPFQKIAEYTKSADITFGNLEGPISGGGIRVGSIYSFRASPKVVAGLQYAGFDVVSIANNHMWDYSREAFLDTLLNLKNAGIGFIGGGLNYSEAHRPWIKGINGQKIAYLAYTDLISEKLSATADTSGINYLNEDQMITDIKSAKEKSDIIIISLHIGDEYQTTHNQKQERIAQMAIDAGALLVIGHHPHVVQEVVRYKNGLIAYSLGNFIFDQLFSKETSEGLILEVETRKGEITDIKQTKTSILNNYQVIIAR